MRYLVLPLLIGIVAAAGCVAPTEIGEAPKMASYEEWGARMALIPEIVVSGNLCEAALVHHRNANHLDNHFDIYEELSMAILLFMQSADQLYQAWERNPDYKDFILLELDKVYDYIYKCVLQRPHYFDPTDPLNIYGGPLTFEQRQKMAAYRKKLQQWESTTGR